MPQLSARLQAALDNSAKKAWLQETGGGVAKAAAGTSAEAPKLAPQAEHQDPPPLAAPPPPIPEVTMIFDPAGYKIIMKNWERITPRMLQNAFRPQLKELLRLRAVKVQEDKMKQQAKEKQDG